MFRHSLLNLPLKDLKKLLSVGLSGRSAAADRKVLRKTRSRRLIR